MAQLSSWGIEKGTVVEKRRCSTCQGSRAVWSKVDASALIIERALTVFAGGHWWPM